MTKMTTEDFISVITLQDAKDALAKAQQERLDLLGNPTCDATRAIPGATRLATYAAVSNAVRAATHLSKEALALKKAQQERIEAELQAHEARAARSVDVIARGTRLRGWTEALKSKIRFFETFGIDPADAGSPQDARGGQKYSQHGDLCDAADWLSPEELAKVRKAFAKETVKESFWNSAAHDTDELDQIAIAALNEGAQP